MLQKKIFILILIESILIVLLACGIFFVVKHYKKYDNGKITKVSEGGKKKNNHYNNGNPNKKNNAIPSVPVEVTEVLRKDMNIFLEANCNIEAEKEIDILSKTSGEVIEIIVEEGESVVSANLLAQLDNKEASLALKEAQVKLDYAKLLYERSQKTLSDKIMSVEEFEEYKLNYQMANVEYEKRKLELDYYTIKSPIEGTVVDRLIEVGDHVQEGQTLFKLAKFDCIYGKVFIPEKDLSKVKLGQTAYISVESIPGARFEGRVKLINPVIDSRSGTIKVTVEIIDEKISLLRPGMFATIHIMIDKHLNAFVIPKKSLIMDSIVDEVFVIMDLVEISLSGDKGRLVSADSDVTIDVKSLSSENGSTNVSQELLSGKIIDVQEKESSAKTAESSLEFKVVIELNGVSRLDLDGAKADINIMDGNGTTYLQVPNTILSTEKVANKTQVELGFSEGDEVEAISGLTEDDLVIIAGHDDLIQGSRVFVVK